MGIIARALKTGRSTLVRIDLDVEHFGIDRKQPVKVGVLQSKRRKAHLIDQARGIKGNGVRATNGRIEL